MTASDTGGGDLLAERGGGLAECDGEGEFLRCPINPSEPDYWETCPCCRGDGEVFEETGIECEPVQLLSVVDGQRMGFTRFAMYMLLFHCRATGGALNPHPLESADVGWFSRDALPTPTAGAQWWGPKAFAAIDGAVMATDFDSVRDPVWRGTQS